MRHADKEIVIVKSKSLTIKGEITIEAQKYHLKPHSEGASHVRSIVDEDRNEKIRL